MLLKSIEPTIKRERTRPVLTRAAISILRFNYVPLVNLTVTPREALVLTLLSGEKDRIHRQKPTLLAPLHESPAVTNLLKVPLLL